MLLLAYSKGSNSMASNYENKLYKDYEELIIKFDALNKKLNNIVKEHQKEIKKLKKEHQKEIKQLNIKIKNLEKRNAKLEKENKSLKQEILRIKSKNNRDSSNSSKPSSTNGYKQVPSNNREKSNKSAGGQKGHLGTKLDNKVEPFYQSGDVEEQIIEINKNENNKNKHYIERRIIDIKITKLIKILKIYPDKKGNYPIPKYCTQNVVYGPNIKAVCTNLMNHLPNSTDGVASFISDITNNGITLSKGTLILWNKDLANRFVPVINNIDEGLNNSYYINHDESQIKVNAEGENILCACNDKYVRLWVHKHKSQEALKEIGFLTNYKGIIVKDGTELYNGFGLLLAQCNIHISRYLKPFYTEIKHQAPKKLREFFSKCIHRRDELIENDVTEFDSEEYNNLIHEYDAILDEWEKELREDINNHLFNDEYCLWRRLKYDNKQMDPDYRGDREEVLYFLKDFKVPVTNNNAESAQRPVKIKQKIGKFRSEEGANTYAIIRSCISTYKKQGTNVYKALVSAFKGIVALA